MLKRKRAREREREKKNPCLDPKHMISADCTSKSQERFNSIENQLICHTFEWK